MSNEVPLPNSSKLSAKEHVPHHFDASVFMPKSFSKRAFLYATAIYLMITGATVYAFSDKDETKPLEVGGATISLALDQFGPPSNEANNPVEEIAEPTPEPEPEVQPEPEPEVQPEPEPEPEVKPEPIVKEIEAPAPPVVKKEVKPKPKKEIQEKKERKERKEHHERRHVKHKPQQQANPDAKPHDKPREHSARRGGSPHQGKVMVFGRDNHPVLVAIKSAIDKALIYPRKAQMLRQEGTAVVQFTYTKSGNLKGLRLLKSTGIKELDEAAMRTIVRASANFPSVEQNYTLRLPITFDIR